MLTIYTLKTCDTCRKAIKWLDETGMEFTNHDVRADGLTKETVEQIVANLGAENALNRRSTTWRNLSDADKADIDNAKAIRLIAANPTLMKRPVFIKGQSMIAGFNDGLKEQISAL